MNKHTPGPWEIKSFSNGIFIKPINNAVYVATVNEEKKNADANAQLIAAAPKLLEACKIGLEALKQTNGYKKGYTGYVCDVATIQEAINKATKEV
jgi:hypothetical protein